MGFKTEKELEDYLTDSGQWAYKRKNKTNTEPQRLPKESKSDTQVIVNNGNIQFHYMLNQIHYRMDLMGMLLNEILYFQNSQIN